MPDITPLLRQRWSPKTFDPTHTVDDEQVSLLLEAARWAPSARNVQPWRFILGRRGDQVRARIEPHVAGKSAWALDASLLVVNIYDVWRPGLDLAIYDLGGAVAHMSVQGEALGLHARQFASFDVDALQREFGIERPYAAATITAFGVPPEGFRPDDRTRLEPEALLWLLR